MPVSCPNLLLYKCTHCPVKYSLSELLSLLYTYSQCKPHPTAHIVLSHIHSPWVTCSTVQMYSLSCLTYLPEPHIPLYRCTLSCHTCILPLSHSLYTLCCHACALYKSHSPLYTLYGHTSHPPPTSHTHTPYCNCACLAASANVSVCLNTLLHRSHTLSSQVPQYLYTWSCNLLVHKH